MTARRESQDLIFRNQPLVSLDVPETQMLVGVGEWEFQLASYSSTRRSLCLRRQPESDLPEKFSTGETKAITAAYPHEILDCIAGKLWGGTPDQVTQAAICSVALAVGHHLLGNVPATITHEPESDANGISLDATVHVASVDVRQFDVHVMPTGIASQRVERVETHWLIVEQCRVVLDGVVTSEPGRLVGEQSECGCV